MSEKNTGGPAFPIVTTETNEHGLVFPFVETGMTLRDYAAIHIAASMWGGKAATGRVGVSDEDLASDAELFGRMADAMLAERAK